MDDESNPSCTPIPAPEPAAEPNLSKSDPARASWLLWELGLLTALGAIMATPAESNHQAVLGIVCLLFLMGLANYRSSESS